MTEYSFKPFWYTILVFVLMCALSYAANAQSPAQKLSIKDAVSLAVKHNRDIKTASLDIDKAQEQVRIAKSLLLPTINANAQAAHYFLKPVFFGFGGSDGDKVSYGRYGGADQATATVNVIQPLYDASARPAQVLAKLQEEESRLHVSYAETDVAAIVKQTYLLILVLSERIKLQNESINRNQKALQDAKSLLAQGRALRVDTLRAYTTVKNLEPDILKLTNAIDVNTLQLKVLMGLDAATPIELGDSLVIPAEDAIPAEEDVYAQAKDKRPDYKAVLLQPSLNDQQIKLAGAATKPYFSVFGQYLVQTQSTQFNYLKAYYPSTPIIGAQLSIPIFSGYSNAAKIKRAQITRQQSLIQVNNAGEQLKVEAKRVVADLHETQARLQTRVTVKQAAQLSYDITQYRYAKGVASRLELEDAELALTTAQSNYLEAVYDYLSVHITLDKTVGVVND